MNRVLLLLVVFLFQALSIFGQKFNKALNKDSLLQTIVKDMPEAGKAQLLQIYNESDEMNKEFLLFMYSMPRSSKIEMISNIDSNFEKINRLNNEYSRLVPDNYIVSIEFNPANKIVMTPETIDLKIKDTSNSGSTVKQEWNLEYNSKKLAEMIKPLGWTNATLDTIKKLLADAKCVSIENGEIAIIGFARSGLGKYSFRLFRNDLTDKEIKSHNDGCTYIFYKKNIVLQYGGGAVGAQCFPD